MKKLILVLVLVFAIISTSACSYGLWGWGGNGGSENGNNENGYSNGDDSLPNGNENNGGNGDGNNGGGRNASSSSSLASASSKASSSSTTKPTVNPNSNPSVKPSTPTTSAFTPVWGNLDPVVYTPALVVFDKSNPMDVQIDLGSSVTSVKSIGYAKQNPNTWNFKFENNKLYIPKTFFTTKNAGKYDIEVNINGGNDSITCQLCCATKNITTTDEFCRIGIDDAYPLKGVYVLGNDLDFEGDDVLPIGFNNTDNPKIFSGIFEGAGHKISNLDMDLIDSQQTTKAGLFCVNQGTISNLCLKNCSLSASGWILGLVVGENKGTIENVLVDAGSVYTCATHYFDTNCFIAGFAGINSINSTIKNCICAIENVTSRMIDTFTRSFCGKTWGDIINCYATQNAHLDQNYSPEIHGKHDFIIDDKDVSDSLYFAGWGDSPVYGDNPNLNSFVRVGYYERNKSLYAETGYGFTYTAVEAEDTGKVGDYTIERDGIDYPVKYLRAIAEYGSFEGCAVKTRSEMSAGTTADMYKAYDVNVWTINGNNLPQLKVLFTYNH